MGVNGVPEALRVDMGKVNEHSAIIKAGDEVLAERGQPLLAAPKRTRAGGGPKTRVSQVHEGHPCNEVPGDRGREFGRRFDRVSSLDCWHTGMCTARSRGHVVAVVGDDANPPARAFLEVTVRVEVLKEGLPALPSASEGVGGDCPHRAAHMPLLKAWKVEVAEEASTER